MRRTIVIMLVIFFAAVLLFSVTELPEYGSFKNREVAKYYLENSLQLTGSANVVNAIVWDFRGYDTLGEEIVLLTAALGVFVVIRREEWT